MSDTAKYLAHEATTAMMAEKALEHPVMVAFIETLDYMQESRFREMAHHLLYVGFEEGLNRQQQPPKLTDETKQGIILGIEVELFIDGARIHADIMDEK